MGRSFSKSSFDWPGLKNKELFQGRDLNSTMTCSVYASAMSTVFDIDLTQLKKSFLGRDLQNLSDFFLKLKVLVLVFFNEYCV